MTAPHMPRLQRDLAWLLAGFVAVAGAAGAGAAMVVDWFIHRHRP